MPKNRIQAEVSSLARWLHENDVPHCIVHRNTGYRGGAHVMVLGSPDRMSEPAGVAVLFLCTGNGIGKLQSDWLAKVSNQDYRVVISSNARDAIREITRLEYGR